MELTTRQARRLITNILDVEPINGNTTRRIAHLLSMCDQQDREEMFQMCEQSGYRRNGVERSLVLRHKTHIPINYNKLGSNIEVERCEDVGRVLLQLRFRRWDIGDRVASEVEDSPIALRVLEVLGQTHSPYEFGVGIGDSNMLLVVWHNKDAVFPD